MPLPTQFSHSQKWMLMVPCSQKASHKGGRPHLLPRSLDMARITVGVTSQQSLEKLGFWHREGFEDTG